jgi:ElaB/YqjD/DUF883 family membrane-anchored ribosome-binding protein
VLQRWYDMISKTEEIPMLTNRMNENKSDMNSGASASDIKSVAKEMRNYPEVEDLKTDVGNLKADVSNLASRVKADGAALASKVGQEIEAQANEKYSFFKRESRKQLDRVEAKVHEKPMQSIAVAFGAGIALALLARR